MFFGSSTIDLEITITLLVISLIIAFIAGFLSKRILIAILIFSFLGNLVFLLDAFTHSEIFRDYGLMWLGYFSFFVWPILNILLTIYFIRTNSKVKPKKAK